MVNDPNVECTDHPEGYSYETCVQDEVVDRIESILNCAPPWMLSYELQNVSTGNKNVSSKEYREVGTIFSDVYNTYKSISCKMACRSPAYEIAKYKPSEFRDVLLRFDNDVLQKSSHFSIGY